MRCVGRIAKEVGGGRESVLWSALIISSWGPDLPHASVILQYIPLDEDFDLDLYNRNCNLRNFVPAGRRS
jgi:hypothetical protein